MSKEILGTFRVTTIAILTITCGGEAKKMLVTFVGKDFQDQITLNIKIKFACLTMVGEAIARLVTSITLK